MNSINLSKYEKAFHEKLLKNFTLKAVEWSFEIHGVLKLSSEGIQFKVLNGLEQTNCLDLNEQLFNITFSYNGASFQVQQNALHWIKEHDLFEILIENEKYLINEARNEDQEEINQIG